jgi:regulator of PEP synthase PpsR (kinase-PPPase family)
VNGPPTHQLFPSASGVGLDRRDTTDGGSRAAAQYASYDPLEHIHPLIRTPKQLERVLNEIEASPGIVLYTLLERALTERLEAHCRALSVPYLSILGPVLRTVPVLSRWRYQAACRRAAHPQRRILPAHRRAQLQHAARRRAAPDDLEQAEVVLVGVSRTSKTPTSIYLANRGVKTANVPLVPACRCRRSSSIASASGGRAHGQPERIVQIRQNRLLGLRAEHDADQYVDRRR